MKKMTPEEEKACQTGRKVQILILLEKTVRMTSTEILEAMNMEGNLQNYTKRLKKNGLITIYDQSKFMKASEANYKYHYHSITDLGRELIADLGR